MVLFQTIQFFHMLKAPVLGRNQELGVCVCVCWGQVVGENQGSHKAPMASTTSAGMGRKQYK